MTAKGDEQRRIKSIEVGFRTIRVLEAADGFLPLVRIAALSGMPASKAYIYLTSFVREGLVMQDPKTGHFGLGPLSVQLGLAAIRNLDVVAMSRDIVDRLRDDTGCGVSLSIWGNRGPCLVEKADGAGQGSLVMRIGHVFWPTSSATGRIFLAFLPEQETEGAVIIERQVRSGVLSAAKLKPVLADVRTSLYAVSAVPTVSGRTAVAAPVFDFSRRAVASLAILADEDFIASGALKTLFEAARDISRRLGADYPDYSASLTA